MDHNKNKNNGRPLSEWFTELGRRDLIEMICTLCDKVIDDVGESSYRGGIRPGNIFRNEEGILTLGEGGMPQRSSWTAEQLEFISPEEFWNGEASERSDVYSLGLLTYYCVSGGKLPFQPDKKKLSAEERAKTVRRRMGGEPINAPEGSGKSLGSIIEKALSFRPEDRYTAVDDLPVVLKLCVKELDSPKTAGNGMDIEKSEEELSDAENMMVGIISKAAEEAALSDGEKSAEAEPVTEETEQDIEVEIVDLDEEQSETEHETAADSEEKETAVSAEESSPDAVTEQTETSAVDEEKPSEESAAEDLPDDKSEETAEESAETPADTSDAEPAEQTEIPDKGDSSEKDAAAAAAIGAAAAGTVLASRDERIGAGAGPRTPGRQPAKGQGSSKPAVSYNTAKKEKTAAAKRKKKNNMRAALALLLLCALLVLAAIILNAMTKHKEEIPEVTPIPTATAEVAETEVVPEAPETEETVEPQPTETGMTVYKEDSSWTAAESKCESQGGHLAVIHNQEDLDRVIELAKEQGIRFIWIGCQRMSDGALHWVNGDSIDFYAWADGEPSLIGSGGESEDYIMLWNTKEDLTGQWVYNDVGNNPALEYASTYSGRMGYIMETGN